MTLVSERKSDRRASDREMRALRKLMLDSQVTLREVAPFLPISVAQLSDLQNGHQIWRRRPVMVSFLQEVKHAIAAAAAKKQEASQ